MKLTYKDKQNIIKNFPRIELSYEKKVYKKAQSADIYLTIPKGKKYFLWFRFFRGNPTCILLELSRTKKSISDIFIFNACFNDILATTKIGTICYGTLFLYKNTKFFNMENIFHYKGKTLVNKNQEIKLNIIADMFKYDIKQIVFTNNDIVLGLPIIEKNKEKIISISEKLPYQIYSIQHRSLTKNSPFLNENIKQTYEMTFKVKADMQTDIYFCYYNDDNIFKKHNVLYISDYKTSVFMNRLFRRIIENDNIDNIEESEDEEDFENISDDKFVKLDKEFNIDCVYCEKYKLWKPMKVSNNEPCNKSQLMRIENNYI
jgi:hypothetical protein